MEETTVTPKATRESNDDPSKSNDMRIMPNIASVEEETDHAEELPQKKERLMAGSESVLAPRIRDHESLGIGKNDAAVEKSEQEIRPAIDEKDITGIVLPDDDRKISTTLLDIFPFRSFRGRSFVFPFALAKTWPGMKALIQEVLADVEELTRYISEESFDLHLEDDVILLPKFWDAIVCKNLLVTLHFRPFSGDSPPSPGSSIFRQGLQVLPRRVRDRLRAEERLRNDGTIVVEEEHSRSSSSESRRQEFSPSPPPRLPSRERRQDFSERGRRHVRVVEKSRSPLRARYNERTSSSPPSERGTTMRIFRTRNDDEYRVPRRPARRGSSLSPTRRRTKTFSRERLRDSSPPNFESRNRIIQNRNEPPLIKWVGSSRTFSFKKSKESLSERSALPPPRPAPGFADDGKVDNSYQVAQNMVLQKSFQAFDFKVLMLWDLLRLQRKISDKLHTFRDKPGDRDEKEFFDTLAEYRTALVSWLRIQRFSRSRRQDVDAFQFHLKNNLSSQEYEKLRGTGLWEGEVIDLIVAENATASRVRRFLQKILPFRISTASDEVQFEEHLTAITQGHLPRRKSQIVETKADKEKAEMIQQLRERHFSPMVDRLARLIISISGGLLLVVPMIVLVKVTSLNWRLGIVVMSVLLFAVVASQVSRASNQELLTTVAAYAAVLTVFFGQIG